MKVGDYVVVRKDLKEGNRYGKNGSGYCNPDMLKFKGKVYKIEAIETSVSFGKSAKLDGEAKNWSWYFEENPMIEPFRKTWKERIGGS